MIEFAGTKDLAAFLLWVKNHTLYPTPTILQADIDKDEPASNLAYVDYDGQFKIAFYGINHIQDAFKTVHQHLSPAIRQTKMIADFLKSPDGWAFIGQKGDTVDCPQYLRAEIREFIERVA